MMKLKLTMKEANKAIALGLATLMLIHTTTGALAATSADSLLQDVKTLQVAIDSGKVAPADALDRFAQAIVDKNVSVDDVDAFAKSQMTAKQYAAFQGKMDVSLRGIDPATLSSAELGQIVGQAVADLRTEGLYWNGCAKAWTGAALVAAAVIVAVIAVGKNKSDASIKNDYENRIANEKYAANAEIESTQHWQTSFPNRIQGYQSDISYQQAYLYRLQSDRNYYTTRLLFADTDSERNSLNPQISSIDSSIMFAQIAINSDLRSINSLTNRMVTYSTNPGQAAIDIASLAKSRDATTARLQAEQVAALAAAPGQRETARKMGIGAGIGGAIGASLLITNKQSGCFF